ncbi:MAG TPA: phosphate signaling complex protein PhoU [Methanomassiliicoccales archaeon]|jgi:phosphate transport system protein
MTSNISFLQEMDGLNREVREMSDRANEAIEKAVKLIATGDDVLMKDVNRLDKELYHYDNLIEKHCLDLIALYSPVAGDLRTVSACLKIIEDLNRIGRYAHDIAEVSEVFEAQGHFTRMVNIQHMAELVVEMVHDSIESFTKRDSVMARELFERDDEVDSLYDTIFREMLTYMMEDSKKITAGINYVLVARYLERIADHSCNIGERVVYMVTGERMDPAERKKVLNNNLIAPNKEKDEGDIEEPGSNWHELSEK